MLISVSMLSLSWPIEDRRSPSTLLNFEKLRSPDALDNVMHRSICKTISTFGNMWGRFSDVRSLYIVISVDSFTVTGFSVRTNAANCISSAGNVSSKSAGYEETRFLAFSSISILDSQKQQQSSDDLTTCGDPARLASRLNWTSKTPPSLYLQPYTPARLGRVQLEYVSSWTSFSNATYGRFWALHGRTTWLTWRC